MQKPLQLRLIVGMNVGAVIEVFDWTPISASQPRKAERPSNSLPLESASPLRLSVLSRPTLILVRHDAYLSALEKPHSLLANLHSCAEHRDWKESSSRASLKFEAEVISGHEITAPLKEKKSAEPLMLLFRQTQSDGPRLRRPSERVSFPFPEAAERREWLAI